MQSSFVRTGRLNHHKLLSLKHLWAVHTAASGTRVPSQAHPGLLLLLGFSEEQ